MENAKLALSDAKENLKILQEESPGTYVHSYIRMYLQSFNCVTYLRTYCKGKK